MSRWRRLMSTGRRLSLVASPGGVVPCPAELADQTGRDSGGTGGSLPVGRFRAPSHQRGRRRVAMVAAACGALALLSGCDSANNPDPATTRRSDQMAAVLRALLPAGNVSMVTGQTGPTAAGGRMSAPRPLSTELIFDDGHGPGRITVTLNRLPVPVPVESSRCPDIAYHPYSHCVSRDLPDGARLLLDQSPVHDTAPSGVQKWATLLVRPDGRLVLAAAINARDDQDNNPTRLAPPLTLDQLTTIATSPTWQPFFATLPTPSTNAPTQQAPRAITAEQITTILTPLLPAGLHIADQGGSAGFAHLTVDDGHGKSLVTVNVQQWKPNDPAILDLFKNADTLPDGTRIRTEQAPPPQGGRGAIAWTVDTLRSNGLRVLVSAVNASAYVVPATRPNPALTIPQLKQIALDPTWQQTRS